MNKIKMLIQNNKQTNKRRKKKKNTKTTHTINPKLINPFTIMPAYFKEIDYARVPEQFANKTILSFQEVEDIVEYIYTFKENDKK